MIEQDVLRRFIFEDIGVRGTWVNLTQSWQAAKLHQKGPEIAQLQLGQALAAVVMLSSTIKFKGSMILQAQGDGDLVLLLAFLGMGLGELDLDERVREQGRGHQTF